VQSCVTELIVTMNHHQQQPPAQPQQPQQQQQLLLPQERLLPAQQIAALQVELEARDESLFDLQATLAAVQAETQHQMAQHAAESARTVRSLQEQLRRAQQEANLARSTAARQQQQQHQQQQRPVISPTERLVQRSGVPQQSTTTAVQTTPLVPPPQHPTLIRTVHRSSPLTSSGQRLAQHLLRSTATFPTIATDDDDDVAGDHHDNAIGGSYSRRLLLTLSHVAAAAAATPPPFFSATTTTTTTASVSDIDVVWWLVLELLSTTTPTTTTATSDDEACDSALALQKIVDKEEDRTKPNVGSDETSRAAVRARCLLLLTWLHDALAYSPAACQFLVQAVSSSQSPSELSFTANNAAAAAASCEPSSNVQSQRGRSSCIRIIVSGDGEQQQQQHTAAATRECLQRTERELYNPLWMPSSTTAHDTTAHDTTAHDTTAGPATTPNAIPKPRPMQCQYARRFLQQLQDQVILGSSARVAVASTQLMGLLLHSHVVEDAAHTLVLVVPDGFLDAVLRVWTNAATHLVKGKHHRPPPTNDSASRRIPSAESTIPLRLLQPESLSNDAPVDATAPRSERAVSSANALVQTSSSQQLLIWMAESLRLVRMVWNHSASAMRQSWSTTGRAATLLASVLNLFELYILPDNDLHSHPITIECIAWLQELASQRRRGTVDDRMTTKRNLRLLRTQQATAKSTAELWHFAPTAIAVAVQLLHRVVIRQHMDDHLPASPVAIAAVELTRVRDQLVRFVHGILQAVQEDRRRWEKERANKTSGGGHHQKQALSFMAVLSECLDYYTSAAAALLAIPDDGVSYCKAHPDIQVMLKMQMDELAEDQDEKLVMDTADKGAVHKTWQNVATK
jgi:hypothetical protein